MIVTPPFQLNSFSDTDFEIRPTLLQDVYCKFAIKEVKSKELYVIWMENKTKTSKIETLQYSWQTYTSSGSDLVELRVVLLNESMRFTGVQRTFV